MADRRRAAIIAAQLREEGRVPKPITSNQIPPQLKRAFSGFGEFLTTPPRRAIVRPTGVGTITLDELDKGLLGLNERKRVQRSIVDDLISGAVQRRRATILRASKLRRGTSTPKGKPRLREQDIKKIAALIKKEREK